jgi:hypothetical protein
MELGGSDLFNAVVGRSIPRVIDALEAGDTHIDAYIEMSMDTHDAGSRAVHLAARCGATAIVDLLLNAGARSHDQDMVRHR